MATKIESVEHRPRFFFVPSLRRRQDSGGASGSLTAKNLEHDLIWKLVPTRRPTGRSHGKCLRGQPQCCLPVAREGEQNARLAEMGFLTSLMGTRDGTEEPEVGLDGKEVGLEDLSSVI